MNLNHLTGHNPFELLAEKREEVEARFEGSLEWHQQEGQDRTHLAFIRDGEAEIERTESWPEYREWLVAAAVRLRSALQPAIATLGQDP